MNFLPDWNSVESTARWSDFLFWAGILALILLAVTEVASHIYGSRSAYLATEKSRNDLTSAQEKISRIEAARVLSEDQTREMIGSLSKYPLGGTVIIMPVWSKPEVIAFASQLADIASKLKRSDGGNSMLMLRPFDRIGFPKGVTIEYAPDSVAGRNIATEFARLLKEKKITANATESSSHASAQNIFISVGEIP